MKAADREVAVYCRQQGTELRPRAKQSTDLLLGAKPCFPADQVTAPVAQHSGVGYHHIRLRNGCKLQKKRLSLGMVFI